MKSRRYPYRIITPLPLIEGGGGIPTMTPRNTAQVNIPNMTAAPERMSGVKNKKPIWNDPDLKANLSAGDLATGVAGMLSNGVTDYFQTGNLGNAISSIVDTGIKSIPVAGQIVAAADMIADPIASAFGNAASSDPYNQTAKRFINPLNSLESGISNLVNGNSSEGWTDLASVVLPGLGGVMDANKAKEKARLEDLQRFKAMQASVKSTDIKEGRGGKYWDQNQLMQAEMGGPIFDQNSTPKGMMVTAYNEGGEHSENKSGYGGVPVDQFGNKVVASNARPVATTEEGEISYFSRKNGSSYVFSNKLFV